MASVTDIDGVGDARAETMAEEGYDSLESIAEADPADLAEDIPRVTEDRATTFTLQAENLLEGDEPDEEEKSEEEILGPMATEEDEEDVEGDEGDTEVVDAEAEEERSEEIEDAEEAAEDAEDDEQERVGGSSGTDYYDLTIESDDERVETEFVAAVTERRRHYRSRNPTRSNICEEILDQYRENGLNLSLTRDQLNVLHSAIRGRKNTYKGSSQIEEMELMIEILEQVQEVRDRVTA